MPDETALPEPIRRFAAARLNTRLDALQLAARALRGGLMSRSVHWVEARVAGSESCWAFVAKRLEGSQRREARIHAALMSTRARVLAPELLAVVPDGQPDWLFLEAVPSAQRWPWAQLEHASQVLRALAYLHEFRSAGTLALNVSDWDYERELREGGARLLELLECCRPELRELGLSRAAGFVRCFARRSTSARRRLLQLPELPPSFLHGDVHSGNVVIRPGAGGALPILLDWGRARMGSPLEDVSSWLQSLAFWEPRARQRHDTLLRAYLQARGQPWPPTRGLRAAYWVAAACNCLAGSAELHLRAATDPALDPAVRSAASAALRDQLRVVRRAQESS